MKHNNYQYMLGAPSSSRVRSNVEEAEIEQKPDQLSFELMQTVDDSLLSKGILFLEDEETYNGITLYVKKQVMDIASSGKLKEIEIHIHSDGGRVTQFMSLYHAIIMARELYNVNVKTIVNSIACSSAAFVLQAGSERLITRNSFIMLHEVSGAYIGKISSMKEEFDIAKKFANIVYSIWASKMGISIKELVDLIEKKDVYFSAKQALKAGLVDAII